MNDLEEALKGVLEHSSDHAMRLAYANVLDARNDPLGEFIRLECQLAYSPIDGDEALKLWDRRLALLEAHGESWLAPVAGIAVTPQFGRGLVEGVALDLDTYLEHGADVFGRFPVRSLAISGAHGQMREFLASRWLDRIEYLSLPDSTSSREGGLGDDDVEQLASCDRFRNLRGIDLGWNRRLGPKSVASILDSPWCDQLELLDLGWTAVGNEGASLIASSDRLGNLRRLDLSNTALSTAGARALADSPTLARLGLTEFDFSLNHDIDQGGYARLLHSPVMARVAEVNLAARIDDELIDAFLRSDFLGSMKALHFGNSWTIDSASIRRLAQWTGLAQLNRLTFVLSGLTDEQLENLATTPWLGDLKSLCLSETKVTDDGIERLCRSPVWQGLEELEIDRNGLTVRSVQAILAAVWFPRLRSLDLHASYSIGDDGAAMLASYGGQTRLRSLILSIAGVGDAGALALADARFASQLWTLWLRGNERISPGTREHLRDRLRGRVHVDGTDNNKSWLNQPSQRY